VDCGSEEGGEEVLESFSMSFSVGVGAGALLEGGGWVGGVSEDFASAFREVGSPRRVGLVWAASLRDLEGLDWMVGGGVSGVQDGSLGGFSENEGGAGMPMREEVSGKQGED